MRRGQMSPVRIVVMAVVVLAAAAVLLAMFRPSVLDFGNLAREILTNSFEQIMGLIPSI